MLKESRRGLLGGVDFSSPLLARADGSRKGIGLLGPMQAPSGETMTEFTVDDPQGNEIPTLVPGLSKEELRLILNEQVTPEIYQKAMDSAAIRGFQGKPPFMNFAEWLRRGY